MTARALSTAMRSRRWMLYLLTACAWPWTPSLFARSAPAAVEKSPLPAALDLPDERFFAARVDPKLEAQLLDSKFVGVALRAPGRVDVGSQRTLPVLVASRFDGARDWDFPLRDLGWLVGVDLASGEVRIASAFGSGKRQAPEQRGARPSGDELGSYGAQVSLVDARSRLDLPWQPGCWALSLVYYDWVSNTVVSRLGQVQAGQVNRHAVACSQLPPAKTGLGFQVERAPDGRVRLLGRYSLPVEVLPEASKALPASALLVASDGASPGRIDLQIPIELRHGTRVVRGDLDHTLSSDGEPAPGTVVYLLVAGRVYGPRSWPATPARRSAPR